MFPRMSLPLNVDSRGTGGTPVLFVHSFAGDVTHWSAQLEHLASTRRAVAFDLSGHGCSTSSCAACKEEWCRGRNLGKNKGCWFVREF